MQSIENRTLHFKPFQIQPSHQTFVLKFAQGAITLNQLQHQYFDILSKGSSIESMVDFFMQQGWLVRFNELFDLISKLVSLQAITNKEVYDYFSKINAPSSHSSDSIKKFSDFVKDQNTLSKVSYADLAELPFFRTLDMELIHLFAKNSSLINVPERTYITKTGEKKRDLFVLLDGEVAVYKHSSQQLQSSAAVLTKGSVFGEGGFFLNHPRSADVVTTTRCKLARINYDEAVFGHLINTQKAQALQIRFWVLHGLLSSFLFKNIPEETFDQLAISGKPQRVLAKTTVIQENHPGNSFYIIIQGNVSIYQNQKLLRQLKQGDSFGEIALMISGGVRTATAITQNECLLLEIKQNEFYRILAKNLALAKLIETAAYQRIENAP